MNSLLPIITFGIIMAIISDKMSTYRIDQYDVKKYIYKDILLYAIMALVMAIFVGLRIRGNDTYAYRQMYEGLAAGHFSLSSINWLNISSAPGLQFVMGCLHNMGASTQDYIMLMGLFTILVYLWFIRKYTCNISLSVFYFITMGVYTFSMAAIKQTTAVAFLVIATDRAYDKKWVQFLILVAIAELFHPYAFIYLIIPFLFFKPWTKRSYILLVASVIVALALERLMGSIFTMTEVLGYENYAANEFSGEGVNIFRVAVVWMPVILSFIARHYFQHREDRSYNLVMNATMINAMIMFIGLFGTANYFARLANYFLIFQTLSLPYVFSIFEEKSKKMVIGFSVLAFCLYFYYQSVWAQGRFDDTYEFITLMNYLKR